MSQPPIKCSKCGDSKDSLEMSGRRLSSNGYCNKCFSDYEKARRLDPSKKASRLEKRRAHRLKNRDKMNGQAKEYDLKIKLEVFGHYGSACACCNETATEFLCIDHVDGDGADHRRNVVNSGPDLYHWLKRNNYPSGFRVLCMNCNCALAYSGYCPHGNLP